MTVKELIEELQEMEQDLEVGIAFQYGDHGRTTAVEKIASVRVEEVVKWQYGNCYRLIDRLDEEEKSGVDTCILAG